MKGRKPLKDFFEKAKDQTPQDDDELWTPGDFEDDDEFLESEDL